MKKLMNSPETLVADWLDGFSAAHSDIVVMAPGRKFLRRRTPARSKVALISGGGSGHEPLHAGFVGYGMLDAACPGQIFTAPTPDQIVEAAHELAGEAGALFIVKNYAGDRMNFEMAAEMVALSARDVARRRRCDGHGHVAGRRTPRRRRNDDRREDARRSRRIGRRSGSLPCARREGEGADALDRHRSFLLQLAERRDRGRFRWGRTKWSWASAFMANPVAGRSKWLTADAIADDLVETILRDLGDRDVRARRCCSSTALAARRSTNSM